MKYKIVGNEHAVGDFIPTSGRNANIQQHYDLYRLHTEIPDYRPYHPCCKALFYCYRIDTNQPFIRIIPKLFSIVGTMIGYHCILRAFPLFCKFHIAANLILAIHS